MQTYLLFTPPLFLQDVRECSIGFLREVLKRKTLRRRKRRTMRMVPQCLDTGLGGTKCLPLVVRLVAVCVLTLENEQISEAFVSICFISGSYI